MLNTREIRRRNLIPHETCPECKSTDFVTDLEMGEVTCRRCGLVLQEEMLDQSPEWRAFSPQEKEEKVRTGAPLSLTQFNKGLATTFQPYRDRYNKPFSLMEQLNLKRLRRWNIRAQIHSSTERNLSQAMDMLTLLGDTLNLPETVRESTALIYRKALDKKLVRGRSIQGIVAAAIYAACRLTRTPRSLKAMVEASNRNQKEISKYYRLIHRELNMQLPIDYPDLYVSKIASKVGLNQKTQNLAIDLLQKAHKAKMDVGKSPRGIAAATLYQASIMSGEDITQKRLAEAAEVTEVTLRNRYKGLDEALNLGLRKIRRKK